LLLRFSGVLLFRFADRAFEASLLKLPPRFTRLREADDLPTQGRVMPEGAARGQGAGDRDAGPPCHHETGSSGSRISMRTALPEETQKATVTNLEQLLADTISLRDLYKKHLWQGSGETFHEIHLLFDEHFREQSGLVDRIAERIMTLGGVSIAMPADVAERTLVPRPPKEREEVPMQISRLLQAHQIVLEEARAMARQAIEQGDDGTTDLLVDDVIRTNESQCWFIAEQIMDTLLVRSEDGSG
jgi:starvation-inducible DNA-binding protein